jgi:pimeloyl-ACP methyl ester carboxylesterase
MHYRRAGHGPALVLLHGGSVSAELCWGQAFAAFSPSFDVIAPDQMGHGRTADIPDRPFDYHAMAEDTVELLSQLGVQSAVFVGWSDGGNLALDIAIHHPALATKIATSGANYTSDGLPARVREWLRGAKASDWDKEVLDEYARESPDGAAHWPALFERLRKMWLSQPTMTVKELGSIKARALVIAGDHDVIRPEHTLALQQAIPGAELAILPHAGHDVVVTDAPRWNAVVLAFLTEPPPQPGAH